MEPDEQRIGGYRITGSLAHDETGRSYLAEDAQSGEPRVVKVLHEELSEDKRFGERFRSVARAMGDLTHARIVGVSEMRRADGRYYVATQYVAGPRGKPMSLQEYLAYRLEQGDGTVQDKLVRIWAIQIAEALAFAHNHGQRHQALRPDKVLIDADNNVRVGEFGLAQAVGESFLFTRMLAQMQASLAEALSRPRAPYTGAEPTAYDYLAPEQRHAAQVDERADIYAFGVLLYRMLTGRGPGNFAQRPSDLADGISPQWDAVVMRCLADGPVDRYPSAEALLKDIKDVGKAVAVAAAGLGPDDSAANAASLEADVAAAAAASAAAYSGEVPQFRVAPRRSSVFGNVLTVVIFLMLSSLIMFGPKLAKEFSQYFGGDGRTLADGSDAPDGDGGGGSGGGPEVSGTSGKGASGRNDTPRTGTGRRPPNGADNGGGAKTGTGNTGTGNTGGAKSVMDALRDQAQGRTTPANTRVRLIAPPMPKVPAVSAVERMKRVAAISTRTPDAIARQFMDPSRLKRASADSEARKAFYMGQAQKLPADKIRYYSRAVEIDNTYAWAYVQRGFAYFFDRQYAKALDDYTKAIELDDEDYVPYYCRALTYEKLARTREAARDYAQAEARAPKNPAWHIQRGNDHAAAGRHDEAVSEYTKAIALDPKTALAYNNRGVVYSDKGRYTEALADLTKAIALDTDSFQAYFNRGLTYIRMKRYDDAIGDNTTALTLKPNSPRALYNRGYAHQQKGNTAEAQRDYDAARDIVAPKNSGNRLFD